MLGYSSNRLAQQIEYYDKRSSRFKRWYFGLSILNIIVLALIPVISLGADSFPAVRVTVALLGAGAAIITSSLNLLKFKENWLEYRYTCEALKAEREKHEYQAGDYKGLKFDEADALLVERCEAIMTAEHSTWSTRMKQADPQK